MSFPNNFTGEINSEYTINTVDEKGNNVVQITSEELTIEDGRILLNRDNNISSLQGINIEYYPNGNLKRYKGILTKDTSVYFPHSRIDEPNDNLTHQNLRDGGLMDLYMNKLYVKTPLINLDGNRDLSYNIFSCAGLLSKYNIEDQNGDSIEKGYSYLVQNEGDFYMLRKNEMSPSINENTMRSNLLLSSRADLFVNQLNIMPIPLANRKNITGNIYYDAAENVLKYYNGSVWRSLYHTTSTQSGDNLVTDGYIYADHYRLGVDWMIDEDANSNFIIKDSTDNTPIFTINKQSSKIKIGPGENGQGIQGPKVVLYEAFGESNLNNPYSGLGHRGNDFELMACDLQTNLTFKQGTGQNTYRENMRISTNGNLLIGQTNDNNYDKLQVNGSMRLKRFRFDDQDGDLTIKDSVDENPKLVLFNNGSISSYQSANASFNLSGVNNNPAEFGLYSTNRSTTITQQPNEHFNIINWQSQNSNFITDGRYIFNNGVSNVITDNGIDKVQIAGNVKASGYKTNNWKIEQNNNDLVISPNVGNNNPILKLTQDGYLELTSKSSTEGQTVTYPLAIRGDVNQRVGLSMMNGAMWAENNQMGLEATGTISHYTQGEHNFSNSGTLRLSVNNTGIFVNGKTSTNQLRLIPQTQPTAENGLIYYNSDNNVIYGYCDNGYKPLTAESDIYSFTINQITGTSINCDVTNTYGSYNKNDKIVTYQIGLYLSNPSQTSGSFRIRLPYTTNNSYAFLHGFMGTSNKLSVTFDSTLDDENVTGGQAPRALRVNWSGNFTGSDAIITIFGQINAVII